ncbi:MAG: lipopolysaccharide biosynthesis protein [Anaerolineales bacterium]|nr:lipopolysaccharide biosynthesis protein [Anaerolineales bacterium]
MSEQVSNTQIKHRVLQGGVWIYARTIILSLVNLVVVALLARKLTPADFGLVALAQVILRFVLLLSSEGVNQFVIYDNKPGREERIQAAFWLDITLAVLSSLIGYLLLPVIELIYPEQGLRALLVVILIKYPIDSISKVPDALIKKRLDFRKLEIRDLFLGILTSTLSLVMVFSGWGIWSLILPGLIVSPIRAIVIFIISGWKPKLKFDIKLWPKIFSYSANVIGSTITSYIISEGDTLLIGKIMGSSILGIYNIAWQSSNLIGRNVTNQINKLILPTLASVSDDLARLQVVVVRMLRVVSIITFPLLIGLFVVADDFILAVYGPQWEEAILPLRILIIYAIRYSIGAPTGQVFKAIGKPDINFKLGLVIVPFYLLAIWTGSRFGIAGVALGVTVVRTFFGVVNLYLVARNIDSKLLDLIRPMASPFFAAMIMGFSVFGLKIVLERLIELDSLTQLIGLVSFGGLIFLILLRTRYNTLAHDLGGLTAPLLGKYQDLVNKALKLA